MRKTGLLIITVIAVLAISVAVSPLATAAPNEKANERAKSSPVVSIPENAVLIGENTYYLGKSKAADGTPLEGFLFVFRANEHHEKPPGTPGKGPGGDNDGETQCFEYIGGEWKSLESWDFNTNNIRGLDENKLFTDFQNDVGLWEAEGGNILGAGSWTPGVGSTISSQDPNLIFFGDINSEGAIAAAWVWATKGKPDLREIYAFDMVFDDVDFDWSNSGSAVAGKMDFNNIAMHEIGHALGMGHPNNACTEETMYAYANTGEDKKRDLFDGDIEGITQLYA